jgi:hypothetical protein
MSIWGFLNHKGMNAGFFLIYNLITMDNIYIIIVGIAAFIAGAGIAFFLKIKNLKNKADKI